MESYNTIIVAGTGQNVGKTSLVCNIILQNNDKNIYAIKISPHFHKLNKTDKIIVKTNNYTLIEETNTDTGKDSAKMLKVGAKKVFYIQCTDNYLPEVFNEIKKLIPEKSNIIIESGGARNIFTPKLFLMIKHADINKVKPKSVKLLNLADKIITFKNNSHNFDISQITIKNNIWSILKPHSL